MMVNSGLNEIRNLMSSGAGAPPTIGVVGSQTTSAGGVFTPSASDTTLTGSYYGNIFDSNTVSNKQNNYELVLAANEGNGANIRSIGIFNTDGDLFAEDTFIGIQKTGSMELQFDINITYADL